MQTKIPFTDKLRLAALTALTLYSTIPNAHAADFEGSLRSLVVTW